MNFNKLSSTIAVIFACYLLYQIPRRKFFDNDILAICLSFLLVTFIGFVLLPVNVYAWHLGIISVVGIILSAFVFHILSKKSLLTKLVGLGLFISFLVLTYGNIRQYIYDRNQTSPDQSLLSTELKVIDYVYTQAAGSNFKVYTYLPSVYDYPYQYLFWWYGQNKYGYLPKDYSYQPNKPAYIAQKEKFSNHMAPPDSGLIFLIKQPDEAWRRELWENHFSYLRLLYRENIGPVEVETRRSY